MLALHELQNYLIFLSQLPVLDRTKSTPKKIIHTPSLNPPFSALDEDVWNTTKEKVAHELPIKDFDAISSHSRCDLEGNRGWMTRDHAIKNRQLENLEFRGVLCLILRCNVQILKALPAGLKSTRSGIFLETLRHSSGKSFDSRFFPFIQLLVNGPLDGLLYFNCNQFQMHSDPLKH